MILLLRVDAQPWPENDVVGEVVFPQVLNGFRKNSRSPVGNFLLNRTVFCILAENCKLSVFKVIELVSFLIK